MIKNELRKLRTLYATREMIEKARALKGEEEHTGWEEGKYITYKAECKYAYYGRIQNLGGYVKVALFKAEELKEGIKSAFAEIFIDAENRDYLTCIWDKDGSEVWKTCKINCIVDMYCTHAWSYKAKADKICWFNRDAEKTIERLNSHSKGIYGILGFQSKVLEEKRIARDKVITDAWDRENEIVPEISQKFCEWYKWEVFSHHLLFYEKETEKGFCSRCNKYVDIHSLIPKLKHNAMEHCPECGAKIQLKSVHKMSKYIRQVQSSAAVLIHYKDGHIIARRFWVTLRYPGKGWENIEKPDWIFDEDARLIRSSDHLHGYFYGLWKNREYRWYKDSIDWARGSGDVFYEGSLKDKREAARFSSIPMLLKRRRVSFDVFRFVRDEYHHPIMEQLAKAGCTNLLRIFRDGYINSEWYSEEESGLIEKLGLDGMRFKRLQKANGGKYYFLWLRQEKNDNTIYSGEFLSDMEKNSIYPQDMNRIDLPLSYMQKYNYLRKQGSDLNGIITKWRDYLVMAEDLKMDLSNGKLAKPKNLEEAHDDLIKIIQGRKISKLAGDVRKKYKNVDKTLEILSKYEYSGEEYCIVAPKTIEDVIHEGIALGHCLHTCEFYWTRMNIKETYILFLRKSGSPGVPYYTLEVEPSGNIRQKRTTGDRQNKDIAKANNFLKKWQKEIQKRLSNEDKALAKKSSSMRKSELKKLRADGNRVWHGVLKGQLLADVLEKDFMPVFEDESAVC